MTVRTRACLATLTFVSAGLTPQVIDLQRPCAGPVERIVVSGTIFTENDQPAVGARIRIVRTRDLANDGPLIPADPLSVDVYSDVQGRYRIVGLCRGQYAVVAVPRSMAVTPAGRQSPTQEPARSYVPTYSPGTPDASKAAIVAVSPGEERTGIDVRLATERVGRITGRVVMPDGRPPQSVRITLSQTSTPSVIRSLARTPPPLPDADGLFTVLGLPPGRYAFRAVAPANPAAPMMWAATEIATTGLDIDNVVVALEEGAALSGRAVLPDGPPPGVGGLRASLVRADNRPGALTAGAQISPQDGQFTIAGIEPGRYRMSAALRAAKPDWILVAATMDGHNVFDAPFEVRANQSLGHVTLIFGKTTTISGHIASGQPNRASLVMAVPVTRETWFVGSPRLRAPIAPATDGSFTISGLPPGDYVVSLLSKADLDNDDRATLEKILKAGVRITLAAGERREVSILR